MRTLILYVMLSAVCCSSLSYNKKNSDDFGLYCVVDTTTNIREIVIRSTYIVTAGKKQDSMAAANGIAFWHRLNKDFYLLTDSVSSLGRLKYSIRFDLKLEVSTDPEGEKRRRDSLAKYHQAPAQTSNTFYVVDHLEKCTQGETTVDPQKADGLTCADYQIWIRREQAGNYIVAAHEIGHTLGLPDYTDYGLMHAYNSGNTNVYESYIRTILKYSFDRRGNWDRNHYDFCIPAGEICHRLRKRPKGPDTNIRFETVQR
ncbi:MAG TPA: hypothetical protein VM488_16415 [Pseudobacter sp.]|nr:hypothetical protein [Pseudobacter sp.]